MFAAQMLAVSDVKEEANHERDAQEPKEPFADGRLRERMHRTYDAAPRQERSQNGKHERGEDQPHIPSLQHAAFFLHHYRMQERRPREPWEERGVLHRVPTPVAAPA